MLTLVLGALSLGFGWSTVKLWRKNHVLKTRLRNATALLGTSEKARKILGR